MVRLQIKVRGIPAAKQSVRFVGGRAVGVTRTSRALRAWHEALREAVCEAIEAQPDEANAVRAAPALAVKCEFRLPGKPGGAPHTSPPDLDNLAKALLDGLEELGLIAGDHRIARLELRKTKAPRETGADIWIHPLAGADHAGD